LSQIELSHHPFLGRQKGNFFVYIESLAALEKSVVKSVILLGCLKIILLKPRIFKTNHTSFFMSLKTFFYCLVLFFIILRIPLFLS